MLIQLIRAAAGERKWLQAMQGPGLPLGLAYIAGALEYAGHQVIVTDAVLVGHDRWSEYGPIVARGLPNSELVELIEPTADAIGITAMFTVDWLNVVDLCRRIRARHPNIPIILGGEHVTAVPTFSLETSGADFVVLGEGEDTVVELVNALMRGGLSAAREVPGIAWRAGERVEQTPPRGRIRELSRIPRPAWHLFDLAGYHKVGISGSGLDVGALTIPILASRGCPYQCTFCAAPSMWNAWLPRDVKDVVDEMEFYVREFGARNFPFYDLTAIIKRSWIEELCREIIRRDLKITWQLGIGTRIEQLDRGVARLLRESGMYYVAFAPESGSKEARDRIKKQLEQEDLERATHAALAEGLRVEFMLVMGFPEDTHADMIASLRLAWWAGEVGVHDIGPGIFTPIPGTELFDEMMADGRVRFSQELLFGAITNFGFLPRFVHSDRVAAASAIAYLYLATASFYLSRAVHHPGEILVEARKTVADGQSDSGMLGRILKGTLKAVQRRLSGAGRQDSVTLPEIDYTRYDAVSLHRRPRPRMQPKAAPEVGTEAATHLSVISLGRVQGI